MTVDHTPSGTPVIELDEREYRAFLEREVRRGTGLSVDEFVRRFEAVARRDDPEVGDLAGLLWLGQNASSRRVASPRPSPTT